jgi:2-polyprenyl-6-methoxyphenol hydroxylase-like FAD-dependent oxidoreductase
MGLNSGVQDAAALVSAIDEAIALGSAEPIERYGIERKEFCESFLQPTTSANHKTVDNPDFDSRKMRLANLSSDANDPQIELEVVARASMLTKILK